MPVIRVSEGGRFAGSRLTAKMLRDRIEALLPREPVWIDFQGIESVTDSFTDELFGVLAERHGGRIPESLEVLNANQVVSQAIEFALGGIRLEVEPALWIHSTNTSGAQVGSVAKDFRAPALFLTLSPDEVAKSPR
jgi:STAS-like domain of unknown function (DUF4325)